MDFLSRSMAQLRDLFASMTPAARITSTLLLGVIVVSLGYLFRGYAGGSKEYLFNGQMLEPNEANRIEGVLAEAELTGWERQGDRILVPRGEKAAYLGAIASAGALPANFDTLLEESLDLGPFVSEPTRKARMKAVRERQLSMIVRQMEGVASAQVLYDIREPKGFEPGYASATVSVEPAPGQPLTPQRMKMIRAAVSGAVAGMNPKDVTILDLSNNSQYGGREEIDAAMFDTPYFQERTNYEKMMEAKIVDLLHEIRGVRVKVTAELDPTLSAEIRSNKPNGDPAPVRIITGNETNTNTEVDDRGPPGLTSQGPSATAPEQAVAKNENNHTNDTSETSNFVPTVEEIRQTAGLAPQSVRAAVAIPSEFIEQVWRARNPDAPADQPPTGENLTLVENEYKQKVEGSVSQLFPRELAESPYPNVVVTVFQSLPADKIEPPSMMSEGLMWAGRNSGSLIMAGLAVVSLGMLRSLVKSIPPAETNVILSGAFPGTAGAYGGARGAAQGGPDEAAGGPGVATQEQRGGAEGAAGGGGGATGGGTGTGRPTRRGGEKGRPRLKLKKGVSMKDDLTEIVREDPDAAAAIIRSWIGNAG
jgi:flagellar M-ring protein FliF